jgi:sec-independent protein translocase protein TatA
VPFGLSPVELVLILLIVLVIFGARRLPEIGRGLGRGIREFKKGAKDDDPGEALTGPKPKDADRRA